jgi:hypothetical protein
MRIVYTLCSIVYTFSVYIHMYHFSIQTAFLYTQTNNVYKMYGVYTTRAVV